MTAGTLDPEHVLAALEARKGRSPTDEETALIHHELSLIDEIGEDATVASVVAASDHFRAQSVSATFGRDSIPSSYVLYALGVHDIDSLEHHLNAASLYRSWAPTELPKLMLPLRVEVADEELAMARRILADVSSGESVEAWVELRPQPGSWFPESGTTPEISHAAWPRFANGDLAGVRHMDDVNFAALHAEFKPQSLFDLALLNGAYRPGHIAAGNLDQLVARRNQEFDPIAIHDDLDQIVNCVLGETYGIVVFDEQIELILHRALGVNERQSLLLRRTFAKYRPGTEGEYLRYVLRTSQVDRHLPEDALAILQEFISESVHPALSKSHSLGDAWLTLVSANRM
jgi:DNA polymerase III alpha subunit